MMVKRIIDENKVAFLNFLFVFIFFFMWNYYKVGLPHMTN